MSLVLCFENISLLMGTEGKKALLSLLISSICDVIHRDLDLNFNFWFYGPTGPLVNDYTNFLSSSVSLSVFMPVCVHHCYIYNWSAL